MSKREYWAEWALIMSGNITLLFLGVLGIILLLPGESHVAHRLILFTPYAGWMTLRIACELKKLNSKQQQSKGMR